MIIGQSTKQSPARPVAEDDEFCGVWHKFRIFICAKTLEGERKNPEIAVELF
jgi:hypothetical protein